MPIPAKILALQEIRFFRYLVAAGVATLVDIGSYALLMEYVLEGIYFNIVSAKTVGLVTSYSMGLVTNFLISKYYVFTESESKAFGQFARFTMVAILVFFANMYFMRELYALYGSWELARFHPDVFSEHLLIRTVSAGTIAVFSFLSHKIFSFRV